LPVKLANLPVHLYKKSMNTAPDTLLSPEPAVTELSLAIGKLVRRLRMEANPGELTLSQITTLARLDRSGAMTTADLARAEFVKPQSMGTTLADLEREGLVQRRPHPTDGRQVLFELTAAGVEARRKRNIAKREWLLAAMERLDPDEQQTLFAAAALIKRLAES
jgi:DNA-binding MarR family transcriptional regulator